ncbi:MAG: dockerin type I repeat-containing protein [bacterium]
MKTFIDSKVLMSAFTAFLLFALSGICYGEGTLTSGLFINRDVSSQKVFSSSASPGQPVSMPETGTNPAPLLADVELILDDGSRENGIGIGGDWEFLWLNRFTPDAGDFPFKLNKISVYFCSDDQVFVGDQIKLVVYENISGNSDPAIGSNFLASFPQTVQSLNAWNDYDISGTPVQLNGPGDVLIGVIALKTPGTSYWPAAIDEDTTQQRSWAGWWTVQPPPDPPILPPDDDWVLIDAYFPGNWLVRGYGDYLAPQPTATPDCVNNGDVNQDSLITAADAQLAFLITLGQYSPSHIEECSADCNGDAQVTAADAQLIFLAGLGSAVCADPL